MGTVAIGAGVGSFAGPPGALVGALVGLVVLGGLAVLAINHADNEADKQLSPAPATACQKCGESASGDPNQQEPDKPEPDNKKSLPDNKSQLNHIFRDEPGHLPDTPENRALLEDVANDPKSNLGSDKFGNSWSGRNLPDGTQVWTQSRGQNIINGGVNQTPRTFNPQTGLSAPVRPR